MPTISIITAVVAGRDHYLREAYESLCSQVMPHGWQWEWLVQEDGETGRPLSELPLDQRISSGQNRAGRAALTRTMALERASGLLIRTLDADDVLPDGALWQDITTLMEHPESAWCVSGALDLFEDGTLVPGPYDPPPGPLPRGLLAEGETSGQLQVVGTTMCTYTSLVRALGGWQALPASEDVALMLAAEAVSDGYMCPNIGLHYRQWPGSSTEDAEYAEEAESAARRNALLQRVSALRESGWRWCPPGANTPAGGSPTRGGSTKDSLLT